MNILILHNKLPYPPKDGGAIAVWNTVLEMAKQNHTVTLLCMNTSKHYFPVEQIPAHYKQLLKIIAIDVNSNIKPIKLIFNYLFSKKAYHLVRFHSHEFKRKLQELISKNKFDFVLFEGLYVLPYIYHIKKHSKILKVFRAHNIEHEVWQRFANNEKNILKRIYLKNLSKRIKNLEIKLIADVELLLTLTTRDEQVFRRLGYKKLSFVSQAGIDLRHIKVNRFEINYPSLFFIGALDWLPNQEGLLWFLRNIWQDLHISFPDLYFEIAGRNAPQWLIKKLEGYSNIKFYGEIDDAYEFMSKRAVMLVPLFSGSGMRIKIIEGMALGKSIVTTTIGTEGISTQHNKNILIADSAEKFKNEIIRLLTNRDLFENIGIEACNFIQKEYDIKKIVSETLNFIQKVLNI